MKALFASAVLLTSLGAYATTYQLGDLTIDAPDYTFADVVYTKGAEWESYSFHIALTDAELTWPLTFALTKSLTEAPRTYYRAGVSTGLFQPGGGSVLGVDGQLHTFSTDDLFHSYAYVEDINRALAQGSTLSVLSGNGVGNVDVVVSFTIATPVPEPSYLALTVCSVAAAGLIAAAQRKQG